jgi:hypothetical protein
MKIYHKTIILLLILTSLSLSTSKKFSTKAKKAQATEITEDEPIRTENEPTQTDAGTSGLESLDQDPVAPSSNESYDDDMDIDGSIDYVLKLLENIANDRIRPLYSRVRNDKIMSKVLLAVLILIFFNMYVCNILGYMCCRKKVLTPFLTNTKIHSGWRSRDCSPQKTGLIVGGRI